MINLTHTIKVLLIFGVFDMALPCRGRLWREIMSYLYKNTITQILSFLPFFLFYFIIPLFIIFPVSKLKLLNFNLDVIRILQTSPSQKYLLFAAAKSIV